MSRRRCSKKPIRVSLSTLPVAQKTACAWKVQTRYEFDGFIRTDIELTAPPETQADSWELVIPFKNENALFFSAIHASSLRMESQQANSVSAAIPEGSGVVWNSDFRPLVWIGNRDAGLSWFSESREYWRPEVNPHAIRIVRHDDRVELRVSLIAQPTVLPEKNDSFLWADGHPRETAA